MSIYTDIIEMFDRLNTPEKLVKETDFIKKTKARRDEKTGSMYQYYIPISYFPGSDGYYAYPYATNDEYILLIKLMKGSIDTDELEAVSRSEVDKQITDFVTKLINTYYIADQDIINECVSYILDNIFSWRRVSAASVLFAVVDKMDKLIIPLTNGSSERDYLRISDALDKYSRFTDVKSYCEILNNKISEESESIKKIRNDQLIKDIIQYAEQNYDPFADFETEFEPIQTLMKKFRTYSKYKSLAELIFRRSTEVLIFDFLYKKGFKDYLNGDKVYELMTSVQDHLCEKVLNFNEDRKTRNGKPAQVVTFLYNYMLEGANIAMKPAEVALSQWNYVLKMKRIYKEWEKEQGNLPLDEQRTMTDHELKVRMGIDSKVTFESIKKIYKYYETRIYIDAMDYSPDEDSDEASIFASESNTPDKEALNNISENMIGEILMDILTEEQLQVLTMCHEDFVVMFGGKLYTECETAKILNTSKENIKSIKQMALNRIRQSDRFEKIIPEFKARKDEMDRVIDSEDIIFFDNSEGSDTEDWI